jgi:shikimate kinase
MNIALIGMSGTGKSYWSHKLADAGFRRFGCDDIIAQRLIAEAGLPAEEPFNMGEWMGMPYEEKYAGRARHYLDHEIAVMHEVLAALDDAAAEPHTVIDTTGSVIYTSPAIVNELRRQARVIYLSITPAVHETMLEAYLINPAPVLWGDLYQPLAGEEPAATFARCYPQLLTYRERLYREISHSVVPYEIHHDPDLTVEEFLRKIA